MCTRPGGSVLGLKLRSENKGHTDSQNSLLLHPPKKKKNLPATKNPKKHLNEAPLFSQADCVFYSPSQTAGTFSYSLPSLLFNCGFLLLFLIVCSAVWFFFFFCCGLLRNLGCVELRWKIRHFSSVSGGFCRPT